MSIFDRFKDWNIRMFVRGIQNTMLFSFISFQEQSKKENNEAKTYNELSYLALTTRPGWKVVQPKVFSHKSGFQFNVKSDYSLADITLIVVLQEFASNQNLKDIPSRALSIIKEEFVKKYKEYPDSQFAYILLNWRMARMDKIQ